MFIFFVGVGLGKGDFWRLGSWVCDGDVDLVGFDVGEVFFVDEM